MPKSRTVLMLILAAAGLTLPNPANATLQIAATINGDVFFCADNTACDTTATAGILTTGDVVIGGVEFNGSQQIQANGPPQNTINTTSFAITNESGAPATIQFAVSGTDFPGPATGFSASGSGIYTNPDGSIIQMVYYADPTNTQGADNALDLPGTLIADSGLLVMGTGGTDSYDFTQPGVFAMAGPYSWTMGASATLEDGAQLLGRSQNLTADVTAVPEPGSLAILGAGLVGFGLLRYRRRQRSDEWNPA